MGTVEKTKYKKLLRASQQMQGFDPSLLDVQNEDSDEDEDDAGSVHSVNINEEVEHMEVYNEMTKLKDQIDELSKKEPIAIEEDVDIDDNASVHSVNVNEDVEHTETYAELKKLNEEIIIKEAEIDSLRKEVDDLSLKHRKHKRRESEVFDQIGADAKNIVAQLEELDEAKKKSDDAELMLAYLKAEKQRTDIALAHAKENVTRYRQEANAMKKKIKELETHRPRPSAFNSLQSKVVNLEKKVEDNANMELQVSFLKAEKQRMEVNLEFQI